MQLNTSVDLNDSELDAVKAAIAEYLARCTAKMAAGERSPYEAHHLALTGLQPRLVPDYFRFLRSNHED